MIVPSLVQLLLVALIVWFIASRRKPGHRAARGFASDDTIAYPARQLDAGMSLRVGSAGSERDVRQPVQWVVAGLTLAILILVTAEVVMRYVAYPLVGAGGAGYLAILVLGGVFLPALKLPAYGLGQPRGTGRAPRGSKVLTVLLLVLLAIAPIQRAMRNLDFYSFDMRMPGETAELVFAALLVLTVLLVVLRLLVDRDET